LAVFPRALAGPSAACSGYRAGEPGGERSLLTETLGTLSANERLKVALPADVRHRVGEVTGPSPNPDDLVLPRSGQAAWTGAGQLGGCGCRGIAIR